MAIDQAGDLVIAGVSLYPASSWACVFVVTKVSRASGAVLWRQEFPDCGEDETWESSGQEQVFIDPVGDVVVGRRDIGWRTFAVYKFSGASGHVLWRKTVGGYPKHGPYAHAITLDAAGNVVTGAGLNSLENRVNCSTTEFVVSKLDATTGAELWRQSRMGTFLANDECEDEALNQALAVAVDGSGDVIAAGLLVNANATKPSYPVDQGIVLKLCGSNGAEIWRRESSLIRVLFLFDQFEDHLQSSVAVDADGDVVTTGASVSPDFGGLLMTVEKLSGADGARIWRRSLAEAGADLVGLAVTVDSRADIAAAGVSRPAGGKTDIMLLKLEGTWGGEVWRRKIAGTAPGERDFGWFDGNGPRGIESDAAGNIIIAGAIENVGTGFDFFAAGFDPGDGQELCRREVDGAAHGRDEAQALAIDTGAVAVVGSLENREGWLGYGETGADGFTVLFDAATGSEIWRATAADRLPGHDGALAVTVDAAGDVLAAGSMQNEIGATDFTVKKLSGTTGAVLWWSREAADDGRWDRDIASSVQADPGGDVIAGGEIDGEVAVRNLRRDAGQRFELGVTKLAGARGELLWDRVIESAGGEECWGEADLAIDETGSAFIATCARRSSGGSTEFSFAGFKLDATDGTLRWCREIPSSPGSPPAGAAAVTVDPHGQVVLAGAAASPKTAEDFTVVRWKVCESGDGAQCDGGNMLDGDCCPGNCTVEPPSTTTIVTSTTTTTSMSGQIVSKDCDDGDACTDDGWSDSTGSCLHTFNTAPCDDGDPCTAAEECVSGACVGRLVGFSGIKCRLDDLALLCRGEDHPKKLERLIRRKVMRSKRLFEKAERAASKGRNARASKFQERARTHLRQTSRKTAATPKPVSAACEARLDALVAELTTGFSF